MRRYITCSLLLLCGLLAEAQTQHTLDGKSDTRLTTLVDRLSRFGQHIPQEKVYLHMDNTCYFLGDTLWFAAYTRTTHNDRPSQLSGTLYVELYNQDGYLLERQLIEMVNGRGHGNFELKKEYYGGYYELRAYTRWQLNWGCFQHKNARVSQEWFLSQELHDLYYRDYDKLYSRVFPVYDAPRKEGEYYEEMTLRPLRRYFKQEQDKRKLLARLYPEGGHAVAGLPCRVAYEVTWEDGQQADLQEGPSRGIVEVIPKKGEKYEMTFTEKNGKKVTGTLPAPDEVGVALQASQTDETWTFMLQLSPGLTPDSLAVTLMHQGVLQHAFNVREGRQQIEVRKEELPEGVCQLTVFDVQGRILADRLFFNIPPAGEGDASSRKHHVEVSITDSLGGQKLPVGETVLRPYQPVCLDIQSAPSATLSMAVRDMAHSDLLHDNATLRTEMLLASEIKGFVANPRQYFEKDDEEHRQALDLLMMIQGWRRFNWREMAVPGTFELSQQVERAPILTGRIYPNPEASLSGYSDQEFMTIATTAGLYVNNPEKTAEDLAAIETALRGEPDMEMKNTLHLLTEHELQSKYPGLSEGSQDSVHTTNAARSKEEANVAEKKEKPSKEFLTHVELVSIDGKDARVVEQMTKDGKFNIQLPGYYGAAILFVSAADTTSRSWKKSNPVWIQQIALEEDLPASHRNRFRVDPSPYVARIHTPYPRFVHPYNYYQTEPMDVADEVLKAIRLQDGTTQMKEVQVGARRNGMKRFTDSIPTFIVDAYEAYNHALDAGMTFTFPEDIARAYVGDYGLEFPYLHITEPASGKTLTHSNMEVRFGYDQTMRVLKGLTTHPDSIYLGRNLASFKPYDMYAQIVANKTCQELRKYYQLTRLDRYVIYTDYQPRLSGDDRYYGSLLPNTQIAVYPYADGSQRVFYRDRRYVQLGYNYADDFYHPDYRNLPAEAKPKDYRRTLYWNPALQLDDQGHATIRFFHNGKSGQISVSAEGMTDEGTMLESE